MPKGNAAKRERETDGGAGYTTTLKRVGEMTPSAVGRNQRDDDARIIADLAEKHIEIDRDVVEIDAEKWAIYGRIAYEGVVIAATFASERAAWAGLARLEEAERRLRGR
jgi:hypothetical protein